MPKLKSSTAANALVGIWTVSLAAFIVAMLYFARHLLIPLTLAALLTFLLAPLVTRLERLLGRIGEVLLQFLVEAVTLSSVGGLVGILLAFGLCAGLAQIIQVPFNFNLQITSSPFCFPAPSASCLATLRPAVPFDSIRSTPCVMNRGISKTFVIAPLSARARHTTIARG